MSAYEECRQSIGLDVIKGMGLPSYLHGSYISRYVFWRKLRHVIAAARLQPNSRVLDFGCGSGILLIELCAEGRTVFATDLNFNIAKKVAQKLGLERVVFFTIDDLKKKIPDSSIDTIIAANVLEHIDNRADLLRLLKTKLKNNGRLVVSGPTENSLYRFGRSLIRFSGDYHKCTVYEVLDDIFSLGFRHVFSRNWPLPGFMCLYKIAAFLPPESFEKNR